jgi:hypothetical protein
MKKGNSCTGAGKCDGADRQCAEGGGRTAPIRLECIQIEHGNFLFERPGASFSAVLGASISDKGFRKFASKAQNDFVG